jgi:hypothetical protein
MAGNVAQVENELSVDIHSQNFDEGMKGSIKESRIGGAAETAVLRFKLATFLRTQVQLKVRHDSKRVRTGVVGVWTQQELVFRQEFRYCNGNAHASCHQDAGQEAAYLGGGKYGGFVFYEDFLVI